ncbi:hypothetical protein SMSP2_01663 [Limihaloglobus sulfuriphilus]|uniref:AsmA domain-containing protein n=1 Tax=Limihaloglobus sulfuriphilus TaxID=1851148 RepID=A0A1Q2MG91_9BACT|nr:hypothetical protein [Limihaloglobus sulfuriphilus]AQQ71292.1 hypothetical protein SMSP2_01663 [Limihaloglobus sulfuriphilus]
MSEQEKTEQKAEKAPKKKSSFLTKLLVLIIIIVVVAAVGLKMFGGSIIKAGIEKGGTYVLGVDVTLGTANFAPIKGGANLNKLVIANPQDYANANMLEMDDLQVDFDLKEVLSGDSRHIKSVKIDGLRIFYEMKSLNQNNIKDILNNLPKSDKEPSADDPAKDSKPISIGKVEVTGAEVNAKVLPVPGQSDTLKFKLDPIVIENIGGDSGTSNAEIARKVLNAILNGIVKQMGGAIGQIGEDALRAGTESVEKVTEEAGKAVEGAGKAAEDIGKAAEDVGKKASEAIEGLGGMFKKKE